MGKMFSLIFNFNHKIKLFYMKVTFFIKKSVDLKLLEGLTPLILDCGYPLLNFNWVALSMFGN